MLFSTKLQFSRPEFQRRVVVASSMVRGTTQSLQILYRLNNKVVKAEQTQFKLGGEKRLRVRLYQIYANCKPLSKQNFGINDHKLCDSIAHNFKQSDRFSKVQ